jgi:hypothetical protein
MRKFSSVNWAMVGWTQLGRTDDVISVTGVVPFRLGCIGCFFFCLTDKRRCNAPHDALPVLDRISFVRDVSTVDGGS